MNSLLRSHARAIWQAAVDAVQPETLLRAAYLDPRLSLKEMLAKAPRILVVGAGKAGAAMAAAVEEIFEECIPRMEGPCQCTG